MSNTGPLHGHKHHHHKTAPLPTFEQLDSNHDGVLTGTELEKLKRYDTGDKAGAGKGDGTVTKDEFLAGRHKDAHAKYEKHLDKQFAKLDGNKDGKLSGTELGKLKQYADADGTLDRAGFEKARGEEYKKKVEAKFEDAFKKLDGNRDGVLTGTEARGFKNTDGKEGISADEFKTQQKEQNREAREKKLLGKGEKLPHEGTKPTPEAHHPHQPGHKQPAPKPQPGPAPQPQPEPQPQKPTSDLTTQPPTTTNPKSGPPQVTGPATPPVEPTEPPTETQTAPPAQGVHSTTSPTAAGVFTSGVTKPTASNTGVGVIRPAPKRVIEGDVILTGNQTLKDVIVHGRVIVKGSGNVIENCEITGSKNAHYPGGSWLVDTSRATDTVVRFSTIRSSSTSPYINGIGLRNFTAERNDISRVVDGFDVDGPPGVDLKTTIKDNYVHDLMFVAPSPTHDVTPTPASYNGPWKGMPWTHNDAIQITGGDGLKITGNSFDARWAPDIGSLPLPTYRAELSVLMLNARKGPVHGVEMHDNWIDGGQLAINGLGGNGSGTFTNNRFGDNIMGTLAFGPNFHASMSGNVWEANGTPVREEHWKPRHG